RVVPITGDATNDAPALKHVDIGLSKGIEGTELEKESFGRVEPLVTTLMWRNLISQALYQVIVQLVLELRGRSIFHVTDKVKNTIILNSFVLCQVFNELNGRELENKNIFKGVGKHRLFIVIVSLTVVLEVVKVEFLKKIANTERLTWEQWGVCVRIPALSWTIGVLVKCNPLVHKKN
ncbi:putative calcium-transporting ATPase 13, plasma membrane-type, partial [Vigna umbellata]|uniref:putative calcium-transporting ATPase 13, plasma membrane-type n=1 Tax=Vigna umbellata TaxID=87088 RepID=UPI001F5EA3A0